MRLTKWIRIQLAIFVVISVVAGVLMIFGYINVPALIGVGQYTVTVQLPRAGGLYENGNVTYRGTEVGRIAGVHLTDTGVDARPSRLLDADTGDTGRNLHADR